MKATWCAWVVGCSFTLVLACSAPPGPQETTTSGATKKDAGTPTGPAPTTDAGVEAPSPEAACGAKATALDCTRCCGDSFPNETQLWAVQWGSCQCETPGVCKDECGESYCNGGLPADGDACDACLRANESKCGKAADTACKGDAKCAALITCSESAKCDSKPAK